MTLSRAVVLLLLAVALVGAEPEKPKGPTGPVSYYRDVRKIFQQHCQGCHQPARAKGGYVMTSHTELIKKGDAGKDNVVAGKPDASELLRQILPGADKKAAMPKNKPALAAADIDTVRRWIAEGAKDDTPKSVSDTISEKNPPKYKLPPVITAIDYSPDASLIAVSGYHEVLLHKADGSGIVGRLIGLSERIQSLAFSPDGKSLAVAGGSPGRFGEIQVWDIAKKKLNYSVSVTYDTLYGVSWSPDGSKIAFGCADNSIRGIEADTGLQILFQGAHSDWVLGTVFSQDGEHVVSVSRDMTIKLTVVKTQRFVDNITSITPGRLKGGVQAVALRPQAKVTKVVSIGDGSQKIYDEVIIGGSDGAPRLYKIHRVKQRTIGDDDNKVRDTYPAMPGRINSLRFNKTGSQFVAGSSLDGKGEVRVYDTEKTNVVAKLETSAIYAVAFRPDGKEVAAAGLDGTIRLIDATTGKVNKEFLSVKLEGKAATAGK